MPYFKKIVGEKCYLSPVSPDDALKWTEWDNDVEIAIPLGDEAYSYFSLEKNQESIKKLNDSKIHCFSIIDLKTDILIGRCLFFDIDEINRQAMFGIVIGDKSKWDGGYGQEATRLTLDYGFNLLNFNNIMLGVFSYNKRGIACYEKVGFKIIGNRREARIIGGKKYDVVLMDILAEEFESPYVNKFIEE